MPIAFPMGTLHRPRILRYGLAALAVAAALANVHLLHTDAPIASFTLAVIVSAWLAGTGPGVAALVGSVLALVEIFMAGGLPTLEATETSRLVYFTAIAAFIVWIVASERRASERIRESERQLQLAIDTIPAMAWSVRPDGSMETLNRRWLDYTGLTLEQALADPTGTMHPAEAALAIEKWNVAMQDAKPYEFEMRLRGADGEYRWFLVRTVPLLDEAGRVVRWYGTSTDIEDRRHAEDRLQYMSRRVLEVHEEERRHFARELHDVFGQLLATINLHLHSARAVAGESARPSLDEASELLRRAGEQVRNLALRLRPAMLETAGLDGTVRWLARHHEEQTGMTTVVEGALSDVPADLSTACFRVVQQALTNVVQHARARHVWIWLSEEEHSIRLAIRDDGDGFDVATLETAAARGHLGILGMKERVQLLGGTLRVDSRPGEGTRIDVRVPLSAIAEPEEAAA